MMFFVSGVARGGVFVPRHPTRGERPYRDARDSRECEDAGWFRTRGYCFPGKRFEFVLSPTLLGAVFFFCAHVFVCVYLVVSCGDFCGFAATALGGCFFCAHAVLLFCLLWRPWFVTRMIPPRVLKYYVSMVLAPQQRGYEDAVRCYKYAMKML